MTNHVASIISVVMLLVVADSKSAEVAKTQRLAEELAALGADQVLERIQLAGTTWPTLAALPLLSEKDRNSVSMVTITVLNALATEGRTLPTIESETILLNRTLRAADVARTTDSKGGYLNELLSESADRVFLVGAWRILDRAPALGLKLAAKIEARKRVDLPRTWFKERCSLDPEVASKREVIEAMKPDIGGFQAAMQLRPAGLGVHEPPTVFEQVTKPDLVSFWWEVYITDFRINAVLRSGIAFIEKGGALRPEPVNKPAAIEAVFGPDGSPYHHDLRRGAIRSDDIWVEQRANLDPELLRRSLEQWFGKS